MDRAAVRVVLEDGRGREAMPCANAADWARAVEALQRRLKAQTGRDRCAAVTVSVHFEDERCDHA